MPAPEPPLVFTVPRFSRWMKYLSIYAVAVVVAEVLLARVVPSIDVVSASHLPLVARRVVPGLELWRLVTYPILQDPSSIMNVLWTVLSFWWLGSPVEQAGGPRRVLQLGIAGTLGGALAVLLGARVWLAVGFEPAMGMAAIASALLAGWGFSFADQQVSFFGSGKMRGSHLALALGALTVLMGLYAHTADGLASTGGLLGGAAWMWLAARRRGGSGRATSKRRTRTASSPRLRSIRGGRDDPSTWN